MNERTFFNEELNTTAKYLEVWKYEVVKVRDIEDLLVYNHYWQDAEGELWLDFMDPNENMRTAFDAYRSRKGFMHPEAIKQLRQNLQLSQRAFSERLGISYSKLSQIETNKRIQTLSQEIGFRKAEQDFKTQGYLKSYAVESSPSDKLTECLTGVATISTHNLSYIRHQPASFKISRFTGEIA